MDYLPLANRLGPRSPVSAAGKHVVIIGGGDTGADCLGTALRQGALSVTQLEIMPRPPKLRAASQPWPTYPMIYRIASAHEEGGGRVYAVSTEEFLGNSDGAVRELRLTEVVFSSGRFEPVAGSRTDIPCEMVLLAMGFTGAERPGLLDDLGVSFDARGNVARTASYETSVPGVFAAGDMGRGQSLIVWAIAEGRSAAASVDQYLRDLDRPDLPVAIGPTARPLV
jgi:glutamate synthase (NADPH/NADH) small chain